MLRKVLKDKAAKEDHGFRLRGMDHTRIEGLSDAVFAIAIALLLISSDVPETFSELKDFMYDFIPFGATIALLIMIWYEHYSFFIKYGLKDATTVFINTILLFLILFYVYPLKFLFKTLFTLFSGIFTNDSEKLEYLFTETILLEDTRTLMVIYGLGAASIFLTFTLLYYYASRKRDKLELNELEIFDTKSSMQSNLLAAFIPLLSALFAAIDIGGNNTFMISGFTYWLYPILIPLYVTYYKRKRQKFVKRLKD